MNKVAYIFSCCLLLIFLASSCKKNESFKVSGMIQGAEGKQIYLEQMALSGNVVIDSAIVKHDASFKFKAKRPEYPDIYRMILEGKQFVFSVDSETSLFNNSRNSRKAFFCFSVVAFVLLTASLPYLSIRESIAWLNA